MISLRNEAHEPEVAQRRERIADLATLPVFFNLRGRKVVLAGESDGAAWKAELLAAAGAMVHVYSEEPGEELRQLLVDEHSGERHYIWHRENWTPDCFKGALLAIGDIEEAEEAERFVASANAAGAVANIIDNLDHCQFQFGSIVNRSPVIISISTDGAAPILGQAIRRRIESLIPPVISDWARLAHRLRSDVLKRFRAGAERRRFWEAFVDLAFSGPSTIPAETIEDIVGTASFSNALTSGRVTFIDTWHGASDLLPMRAIRALHAADIIVYGDETSSEILELARREARRLSINDMATRLGEIDGDTTMLLVKLAGSGKHIVRLVSSLDHAGPSLAEEQRILSSQNVKTALIPTIEKLPVDGS
ncbi:NAD(P)-dependent oxidoreductase [uncultured Cohaesibacter sp.]|uniref:NAD(P)-dependent oxidoreductase n=1 Tax=uncultured Cohaesibacter sp. TaxID=1002546 RepID=UPI0029C7B949|nr:NAD(P)-dependent oxidoreductase [uncultured Cohaesibacter sp.]